MYSLLFRRCLFSSVISAVDDESMSPPFVRLSGVVVGRDALASEADQLAALVRAVQCRVSSISDGDIGRDRIDSDRIGGDCMVQDTVAPHLRVAVGLTDAVFEGGKCSVEERLMLEERDSDGLDNPALSNRNKSRGKSRSLSSLDICMNWVRDPSYSSQPFVPPPENAAIKHLPPPYVDIAPVNRGNLRSCRSGSVEITQSRLGLPQGCALPTKSGTSKQKTPTKSTVHEGNPVPVPIETFEPKVVSRLSRRYTEIKLFYRYFHTYLLNTH